MWSDSSPTAPLLEGLSRAVPRRRPGGDLERRVRDDRIRTEPITKAQSRYLISLASKVSRESFDEYYGVVTSQSGTKPRQPGRSRPR